MEFEINELANDSSSEALNELAIVPLRRSIGNAAKKRSKSTAKKRPNRQL